LSYPIMTFIADPKTLEIREKEITKYLWYCGQAPEGESLRLINKCVDEVKRVMSAKACYSRFPVEVYPDGETVKLPYGEVKSGVFSRHIAGCSEVWIFAATIGAGFDRLIRRKRHVSMSETAVLQATGAAAVEAVCDALFDKLEKEATAEGKYLRLRFSPGYGNLSLDNQKGIFDLLTPAKYTGITLMDSMIMAPEKSVTAIIGISDTPGRKTYETDK